MKKKYDIKTTDVETLKKWYHLMTLGRALDEKAPSYLLQSLGWSYHAPYAGHDGIQLAIGQVFTLGEDFLNHVTHLYRPRDNGPFGYTLA